MTFQRGELTEMLTALSEQLAAAGAKPVSLVVCGGTAMNALGFVARPTRDVDVVALLKAAEPGGGVELEQAAPLPASILAARARVALDFNVPDDWLNDGPASLLHFGLPTGCEERLVSRSFGSHLVLYFLGRFDLICLKLYAWADTNAPRHGHDLRALAPTGGEWLAAARWVLTHNEPEGFLPLLKQALMTMGAGDVAAELG